MWGAVPTARATADAERLVADNSRYQARPAATTSSEEPMTADFIYGMITYAAFSLVADCARTIWRAHREPR